MTAFTGIFFFTLAIMFISILFMGAGLVTLIINDRDELSWPLFKVGMVGALMAAPFGLASLVLGAITSGVLL